MNKNKYSILKEDYYFWEGYSSWIGSVIKVYVLEPILLICIINVTINEDEDLDYQTVFEDGFKLSKKSGSNKFQCACFMEFWINISLATDMCKYARRLTMFNLITYLMQSVPTTYLTLIRLVGWLKHENSKLELYSDTKFDFSFIKAHKQS